MAVGASLHAGSSLPGRACRVQLERPTGRTSWTRQARSGGLWCVEGGHCGAGPCFPESSRSRAGSPGRRRPSPGAGLEVLPAGGVSRCRPPCQAELSVGARTVTVMSIGEDPGPLYRAREVPSLRRELAEWYASPAGVQYYYNAVVMGQQAIRPPGPPGPPEKVASQLAASEADRLRNGDLWYVDEDLCALLDAAHLSMPAFAPQPPDLPSKVGFAMFARPLAVYSTALARRDDVVAQHRRHCDNPDCHELSEQIYSEDARIVAVSWEPMANPYWKAGGLWMSFYAAPSPAVAAMGGNEAAARRAKSMLPPLMVDNEATMAWRPSGAPAEPYRLPAGDAPPGTLTWARLVFAAFQLAAQTNLAEVEPEPLAKPERRRTERAGLPPREVRVYRLRRSIAGERDSEDPGAGTEWRHRWVVRGHWRNHWYPSLKDHRPLWVAPYVKGPAYAPLLGGEKVTVINAPQPEE